MDISDFAMDFFSLKGKNALVTGGNTGLGQAFALALAKAGANVFVPSIMDDDGVTGPLVQAEGGRYAFLKADITKPGVPAEVVAACVDRLGSLDILVNSAGVCPLASVLEFGRPQWDATVAVNLTAAFEMAYEAAKVFMPQPRRQDHQHLLAVLVPGRPLVVGLRGHQARPGRLHQGLRRRARRVRHPGQRHRPRLLRHRDHHGHAQRPRDQPARAGPHPRRALGRARGPHGRHRVPGQPRLGLRERPRAGGRRRLPGALGRRTRHGGQVPHRHRQRHPELQGRHLRPRRHHRLRGEAHASPHGAPGARLRRPPRRRPVGVHRPRESRGDDEVPGRPRRHRRRRPVHHPLLQGLSQGGRHAARARHELDGHARVPAVAAGRPGAGLGDHVVRLHDAPLHRAVPRQRRQQRRSCSGRSTRTPGSGTRRCSRSSTCARSCSSSCRCRATSPAT